jgi:hypothetical protein
MVGDGIIEPVELGYLPYKKTTFEDHVGIPATGKRFSSARAATILELEGGNIRRECDYWKAATFMNQVGLLPAE